MKDDRAKLITKIKAIMRKTVYNGCTEVEALSALNMAQSLMNAYEITEADIKEIKQDEKAINQEFDLRDPNKIALSMAVCVAEFTDCKSWQTRKHTVNFIGLPSDVDFALWLLTTLSRFVRNELAKHLMRINPEINNWNRQYHINGFVMGAASRINQRLKELITSRKGSVNSNAIVVAKQELIVRKINELGKMLKAAKKRNEKFTIDSYTAGKAAGNGASFGRPVKGNQAVLRIRNK